MSYQTTDSVEHIMSVDRWLNAVNKFCAEERKNYTRFGDYLNRIRQRYDIIDEYVDGFKSIYWDREPQRIAKELAEEMYKIEPAPDSEQEKKMKAILQEVLE